MAKTPQQVNELRTESGDALYDDTNDALIVSGVAAHDAAAAGNPVLIGAEADEASADNVDEGDVGKLRMTLARLLKVESSWGVPKHLETDMDVSDIDKVFEVPAGKIWHVTGFTVRLESRIDSGDRKLLVNVYSSADVVLMSFQAALSTPQPVSKQYEYYFMPGGGTIQTAVHGAHIDSIHIGIPTPFVLSPNLYLRFREIAGISAANDRMLINIFGMEANL
jgi:hypothetical protein